MAKKVKVPSTRFGSRSGSRATPRDNPPPFAAKPRSGEAGQFGQFVPPRPKGVVPNLARHEADNASDVEREEAKRFAPMRDDWRGQRERERIGRVRDAALRSGGGLSAAQLRMRGFAIADKEEGEDDDRASEMNEIEYDEDKHLDDETSDDASEGEGEDERERYLESVDPRDAELARLRQELAIANQRTQQATAPAAATAPASERKAAPNPLTLQPVTVEDLDRLWDWIRGDADLGAAFFSRPIANTMELHQVFKALLEAEDRGTGIVRSLYLQTSQLPPQHLGFVMLAPMLTTDRTAMLHVYLTIEARGQLAPIAAALIEDVQMLAPGYSLAVYSPNESWARLHAKVLEPLGFARHTMFVR